ncbi:MAG: VOC family protein [Cytophagales bacterium]|nr:VOC family protein [Cytophagales bacterium]
MLTLNSYLTFDGNCEEAFKFYQSVFGGEFTFFSRFSDMPPDTGFSVSEEEKDKIMHVTLSINDKTMLFGSDTSQAFDKNFKSGNNFSLSINTTSREDADKKLNALAASGGKVIMPMSETFWNSYFGRCVDQYGINWMISYEMALKETEN